jgi:BirA family biotin operon repressor/biotin-[acetyl-CoA-carboxylase] ligase
VNAAMVSPDGTQEGVEAPLSTGLIQGQLRTKSVGRSIECYQVIDSTNRRAAEWARDHAPDGALVVAEVQTAGRGRLGRRWHAPSGGALLMSLVLRPPLIPAQAQRGMICSLAAIEAIRQVAGLEAQIKWPNDLLIAGAKVGGLLTELGAEGRTLTYIVVGMGLNVNLDVSALPDVMVPASSLRAAAGRTISRLDLLCSLLEGVESRHLAVAGGWSPHKEWRLHLATLGTQVRVGTTEDVIEGEAVDVDPDGALIVRATDGRSHRVLAGDVTLRGHRL